MHFFVFGVPSGVPLMYPLRTLYEKRLKKNGTVSVRTMEVLYAYQYTVRTRYRYSLKNGVPMHHRCMYVMFK
jgi:hypothetical protein